MRDMLEQLLRTVSQPAPDQVDALWADYRDRADEAAFATLLAWYGLAVYRRAWGFLRDHVAAEDAFQAAVGKLHANRARLASFDDALRWWRGVVLNEARMILRARRRSRAREAAASVPESAAEDDGAIREALREAMDRLPADQREALALVYFEGMARRDAAAVLGVHRDTLARRLDQALGRLRKALGAAGVLGTAATTATVEAALATAAPVPCAARLAGLATAGVKKGAVVLSGGVAWVKKAAVLLGLAAGGATWAAWPVPEPPKPEGSATRLPGPLPETFQDRNLRVLRTETLPRVVEELRPLALNGGGVRVTRVEAHDFRAWFEVELHHRDAPLKLTMSRLRGFLDTDNGGQIITFDTWGTGDFRQVSHTAPIVLIQHPRVTLRSEPLDKVLAVLRQYPPDPRAAGEEAGLRPGLKAALAPYLGVWRLRGNPGIRNTFGYPADAGPATRITVPYAGGTRLVEFRDLIADPDGGIRFWWDDTGYRLTDGGRRLERGGEWWAREPGSEPKN